jgi:hypothetical protein
MHVGSESLPLTPGTCVSSSNRCSGARGGTLAPLHGCTSLAHCQRNLASGLNHHPRIFTLVHAKTIPVDVGVLWWWRDATISGPS